MTDDEFDWATLRQIARVFRASKALSPEGWEGLMPHASYAAALATSLFFAQDAAEDDRERRDRLNGISLAFLEVAMAEVRRDAGSEADRTEAWTELESLLAEEEAWHASNGSDA
jgi:hypothetical protein